MPWTNPETFTAGQTLTAASMNIVSGNARMGRAVFTNEAARDAAITSPEEGMVAYLTASTVATATGTQTATPTGITTIYNGSVWVCTTPVGAYSGSTGTVATSGSYATTLTGDGTAISATLVTGTTAWLTFTFEGQNTGAAELLLTFSVSGATTVAASDANGIETYLATAARRGIGARSYTFNALTAGTNTFTLNYKTTAGTASYFKRNLTVQGIA